MAPAFLITKVPAAAPGFPESSQFCFLGYKEAIPKNLETQREAELTELCNPGALDTIWMHSKEIHMVCFFQYWGESPSATFHTSALQRLAGGSKKQGLEWVRRGSLVPVLPPPAPSLLQQLSCTLEVASGTSSAHSQPHGGHVPVYNGGKEMSTVATVAG